MADQYDPWSTRPEELPPLERDSLSRFHASLSPKDRSVSKIDRNVKIYAARLEGRTFRSIAEEHGIGHERVRQIVTDIKRRLIVEMGRKEARDKRVSAYRKG